MYKNIKEGMVFGKWTVLENNKNNFKVVCSCGKESFVQKYDLLNKKTTQCRSCAGNEKIDMINKTFGDWIVIGKDNKKTNWICRCKCGNEKSIYGASLRAKTSTKCMQCSYIDRRLYGYDIKKQNKTSYTSWRSMLHRCESKKDIAYKNYGARGIEVCSRWHDFSLFLEDMGNRNKGFSLERIDNNKGYYKENCKWASYKEQSRNKRSNKYFNYKDQCMCLAEWAEVLKVKRNTLQKYLSRHSFEEAYLYYSLEQK